MSQCTSCPTRSPPWHMYAHRPYACSRAHRPRKQFQRLHAEEKPLPVCPPWLWYRRSQKPQGGCINRCIPGIYLELYLNFGPPAPQHPFLRRPAKSRLRPLTASLHRRIILPSLTAAKLLPQSVAELDLFLTDIQMRRKEIL
jgi:hypothetical protein